MSNRFVNRLQRLGELDPGEVAALEAATARPDTIGARKDLIREGDETGPVIVILSGWGARYKVLPNGARQVTGFLMPGDVCDLPMLLGQMEHSIQTLTEAEVVILSRVTMDALLATGVGITRAMYAARIVDENSLHAWIVGVGRSGSSIERVAHLLLELHVRALRIGLNQEEAEELPVPQAVLASALGTTPVHINRMLQELRRSGAVELRRGILQLADPAGLARIAGFDENYLRRRLQIGT